MSLVSTIELLRKAKAGGYAVGAFNCNNMEMLQAIVAAAEAENAPVIIQVSHGAIKYAGLDYIVGLTKIAASKSGIPIALHLDHGTSFDQCIQCMLAGFTSVMIDGSKLPLAENINLTIRVLRAAKAVGVSVEAELGKIGGTEDDIVVKDSEAFFTDPLEAQEFVQSTGVDFLAIAIGTAHGRYKGIPQLNFELLTKIRTLIDVPIVLHGSSGVPDIAIRKAISLGVSKVNIDTNIREAFVEAVRKAIHYKPEEIDPRKLLGPARDAAIDLISEKIRLFGSSGKA